MPVNPFPETPSRNTYIYPNETACPRPPNAAEHSHEVNQDPRFPFAVVR